MKKRLLITVLSAALALGLTLGGCAGKESGVERHVAADSVEITNSQQSLTPGDYALTAKVKPKAANQAVKYSVAGDVKGVSIAGDTLTVGKNAPDKTSVKVRCTSLADTSVSSLCSFTLNIPEVRGKEIRTEAELRAIDTDAASRAEAYILMNDIALTADWEPIGTSEIENAQGALIRQAEEFTGILNGNGYAITGINVNKTSFDTGMVLGFIEQIGGTGEVKNLKLQGKIACNRWSGGICGINKGTIGNVISDIELSAANDTIGAAGALVSDNRGRVEYCYAIGKTTSATPVTEKKSAGLFVSAGDAAACFGDAETMRTPNYQTLTGAVTNSALVMETAYMKSAATFTAYDPEVWHIVNGEYPRLKNAEFGGEAEGAFLAFATRDGFIDVNTEKDFQLVVTVSGVEDKSVRFTLKSPVPGVSLGETTGLLTFDKNTVEDMSLLTIEATLAESPGTTAEKTLRLYNDDFAETGIYNVNGEAKLYRVAIDPRLWSGTVNLTADIVLSEFADWPGIGTEDEPFLGKFDGHGYVISGFAGKMPLFGCVQAATKETVAVRRVAVEGSVTGKNWLGGLVNQLRRGIVKDCFVNVDVTGSGYGIGGVVGINSEDEATQESSIENCIAVGKLYAVGGKEDWQKAAYGGLAGNRNGTLLNCFYDSVTTTAKRDIMLDDGAFSAKTTAELQTGERFDGYETTVWRFTVNRYPSLIQGQPDFRAGQEV